MMSFPAFTPLYTRVCFQEAAVTERVVDLDNSTTNTHQRAQDLLSFISNMTLDITGHMKT